MNPNFRRLVITVSVLGLASSILLLTMLGRSQQTPPATSAGPAAAQPAPVTQTDTQAEPPAATSDVAESAAVSSTPPPALPGVHMKPVEVPATPPATLGSVDPREAPLLLEFSASGAGLERITLAEYWQTAGQSRQAQAHYDAVRRDDPNPPPLPDPAGRYVLKTALPFFWIDAAGLQQQMSIPQLAAHSVVINGQSVGLLGRWTETGPGVFETMLVDETDTPVARVTRRYTLGDNFDVSLEQAVVNLTDAALQTQWIQYGPADLTIDRTAYMDRRRLRVGYLPDAKLFPDMVVSAENDLIFERDRHVIKRAKKAAKSTDPDKRKELLTLWPDATGIERGYELSWFAATNRYFALAVFPKLQVDATGVVTGSRELPPTVIEVQTEINGPEDDQHVFTSLYSDLRMIPPGGETRFDLGIYAGPLDRDVLDFNQPMAALNLGALILYQMSTFCAICTFQWLAIFLMKFLALVHIVTGDWGVSIILLVIVVRTLLHPLTKRAQINMQRFGKVMTDLKPEIEKLQKKYPDDPRKLQQEQMKLMRERGANPLQMLGCLPMVLQMPIWVALYAALYFAFELRHQPAFWGFFQLFWDWPFLADLSAGDHFFGEFKQPFKFLFWNVTGINILPILLGVVFYVQQKYMSPPPSASTTPEQAQQQKIMKIMMVVLFPIMLYSAPSGLTLYICTSSFIGIIESKYVRAHIKAMDLEPPKPKKKKKKPKDLQARAYQSALERARQKRQPPPKKYKKRK